MYIYIYTYVHRDIQFQFIPKWMYTVQYVNLPYKLNGINLLNSSLPGTLLSKEDNS